MQLQQNAMVFNIKHTPISGNCGAIGRILRQLAHPAFCKNIFYYVICFIVCRQSQFLWIFRQVFVISERNRFWSDIDSSHELKINQCIHYKIISIPLRKHSNLQVLAPISSIFCMSNLTLDRSSANAYSLLLTQIIWLTVYLSTSVIGSLECSTKRTLSSQLSFIFSRRSIWLYYSPSSWIYIPHLMNFTLILETTSNYHLDRKSVV